MCSSITAVHQMSVYKNRIMEGRINNVFFAGSIPYLKASATGLRVFICFSLMTCCFLFLVHPSDKDLSLCRFCAISIMFVFDGRPLLFRVVF